MTEQDFDPLFGGEREEIPLPDAPLKRVLCQIRFADIISIRQDEFIAPFQERIRSEYPIFRKDAVQSLQMSPERIEASTDVIHRFIDSDDVWRVSLSKEFISLETMKYVSRKDFLDRLRFALDSAALTIRPSHVLRVGMRYVDQVAIDAATDMSKMLRPEMGWATNSDLSGHIKHTISEVACTAKEGALLARWGLLPENGTHDPDMMSPINEKSWFFDMDMSTDYMRKAQRFDVETITSSAEALASRCYAFFRWAVTDDFLTKFGGKI